MNGKVGVWDIPVSYEWLNGGPMRQELTVHATSKSPITIQMLQVNIWVPLLRSMMTTSIRSSDLL